MVAKISYRLVTAVELATARTEQAHGLAWARLRPLLARGGACWKGQRPLPMRRKEDGQMASTREEVAEVVLHHFAKVEAAEICTLQDMAKKHTAAPQPWRRGAYGTWATSVTGCPSCASCRRQKGARLAEQTVFRMTSAEWRQRRWHTFLVGAYG